MPPCAQCRAELTPATASCPRCGAAMAAPPDAAQAGADRPPALLETAGQSLRAQRTIVAWLAGVFFLLALAGNLLIIIASVPDLLALWFSTTAAILPAVFYSLLVLAVDRHEREPVRVVLGAFAWGAVVATLFSLLLGTAAGSLLSAAYGEGAGELLSAGLGAPLIEESFKGIALLGLWLMFRDEFDNLLDGLVYGAIIGLGFAMTENILYFGRAYLDGGIAGLGELFIAREVFGGFGHALYTGTTGAALGWARGQHGRGRLHLIVPTLGWGLAVFQHFLWNAGAIVIAALQGPAVSLTSVVLLEAAIFIVPSLLMLAAIAAIASARESRIIREQLAEEVRTGVLTPAEYAMLAHGRSRRRAARAAWRRGGVRRWAAREQFCQATAELAFRKYHRSQGERRRDGGSDALEAEYRARIAAARARLVEEGR